VSNLSRDPTGPSPVHATTGAGRIEEALALAKRDGVMGVIPYLTVGYPNIEATLQLVPALAEAGASVIELGVPFSDPLADGVTIQKATYHALQQGVTPRSCLEVCARLRERSLGVPLVLMGYYNPIYAHGLEAFVRDAAAAGVAGLIVVDLPTEEAAPLQRACEGQGVALIPLLAPTSTEQRIAAACEKASGFVYCISLTGVTGAREELPVGAADLVAAVRRSTSLPVAVGFGISRRPHAQALSAVADAVVIGSALIRVVEESPEEQMVSATQQFLKQFTGIHRPH